MFLKLMFVLKKKKLFSWFLNDINKIHREIVLQDSRLLFSLKPNVFEIKFVNTF